MSEPVLYLVGTPIGNLGDISPRCREVLESVDFIAAEDTRNTLKLLNHLGIKKPLISYYEHNKRERGPEILERIRAGEIGALVSDAGMPGISDPGEDLVKLVGEAGYLVSVIPGPCALIAALVLSGLPTAKFTFQGFLSAQKKERRAQLEAVRYAKETQIFYEAPQRLRAFLADLLEQLGDRRIALCRELTKLHETVQRGCVSEMIAHYEQTDPRGEYVVVVEGAQDAPQTEQFWEKLSVSAHVDYYVETGMTKKEAVKAAATDRGVPKNEIYNEVMKK
ncbi:MAG: 16S rRNA (cytidine(1402)-2'-O)-methyltransferase [Clostridia bacterium]|nr:16S rRNA (cytidine(1402)-2'-O)-methyltransferase [Clostridia bacterium]